MPLQRRLVPAILLLVAACAAPQAPGARRASSAECVALFQQFDLYVATAPANAGNNDRFIAPIDVMRQAQILTNAGCITMTRDLAGMEALPATPIAPSGAAIPPVYVHAGVVTSSEDDARSIAFFSERGLPARSVGQALLGRRVYVGPIATEGQLTAAIDLAVRAGFHAPYPRSRF